MAVASVAKWSMAVLVLSACARTPTAASSVAGHASAPRTATEVADPRPPQPASPATPALEPARSETRNGLTWYEDAAPQAFEAARSAGKLVLADLWAPWCHTCLSMQNFVLTAANLPRASERYVFLAIDTERAENAAFLERFTVGVWPTFYVISVDPEGRREPEVVGRWLGAAAAGTFARFLDDSARIADLSRRGLDDPGEPLALVREGDRLATERRYAEAAAAYGEALARAPADFPRLADTLVARISALSKAKDVAGCVALAQSSMTRTGSSPSAIDFASTALTCADDASVEPRAAREIRQAVERRLKPLCEVGSPELSPDDQSDACDRLRDARARLGDEAGARAASLERLAVLERAAQGLPDDVAVTYDWARVDTLIDLGRAEGALELCLARERALPQNYNPPAYRARIYKELRRFDEGLAALERALALAYGPRRLGLLSLKIELLLGAGRKDEARGVLEEQLAGYRDLPAGQRQPAAEARVEERLKQWR